MTNYVLLYVIDAFRLQKSYHRANLMLKKKQDELNRARLLSSTEEAEESQLLRKR